MDGRTDGWIDGMNMYCVIRNIGIVGVGVGEFFCIWFKLNLIASKLSTKVAFLRGRIMET